MNKLNRIGSDKNDPKLTLRDVANEPVGILQYDEFIKHRDAFLNNTKTKEKLMENKSIEETFNEVLPDKVEEVGITPPLPASTPAESDNAIDSAVNSYVDNAKSNAEDLKNLYTEQGATEALYKQVSSATNMMMEASAELTTNMIDEQANLIKKVIEEEKAKGELADQNAIAQAEQVLATVEKFKDEEYMKIMALKEASEKAPKLYEYLLKQTENKEKMIRSYRAIATNRQIILACEDLCKTFKMIIPLKGANAVVGLETTITAALSNVINKPKTYGLESLADFVYSENITADRRGAVTSKAIRFVIKFIAEHTRQFLIKEVKPEERGIYQFIMIDSAITAIIYDEALEPTNTPTSPTEGFTKLVAELLKVYFADIKVNSLK